MTEQATRLGTALADRYRIERELGRGGMATVYLAEDLKHKRRVALKVLKPELAAVLGAERFVQEITTTAALQHPHILPLFDSGTADGFLYYVMPFIDGETLRSKLDRETQLGIDEAVTIARNVADALDYAHRQGVIHRDIKPENILLHDGRPMVADFGIALALSAAAGGRMTETGMSLGTPHYMSPEQATAEKEITARSDVYSLGSVLYEMLAGQPPHLGGSAQQIIMRIVTDTARPVTELRRSVPANVAAAVAKSLEKLPADRFATASAFGRALGDSGFTVPSGLRVSGLTSAGAGWRHRSAIPALAVAALLVLTTGWALTRPAPVPPVARYQVALPEGQRIGATQWAPIAVSPDGSHLAYIGESGHLFIRARDRLESTEIEGSETAFNPFFSPDGTQIGFMSGPAGNAQIKVASLAGGPTTLVTSTGVGGPGAAWGFDGYIYFDASGIGPLMRVPAKGGTAEAVSALDSTGGELQHNWPDPLPNGRGVLVIADRGGPGINVKTTNDVAVIDLATHRHRVLVRGVFARYAASGHILYVTHNGVLMAVPFDQDRMELTGSPVSVIEGINVRVGGGGVDLAISRSGTLWYGTGSSLGTQKVFWFTRTGARSEVDAGWSGDFGSLALSPDGTKLAIAITSAEGDQIWIKQLGRAHGTLTRLTHERSNSMPRWHPDGKRVAFESDYLSEADVRVAPADGSAPAAILRHEPTPLHHGNWSPDGRWFLYQRRTGFSLDLYGLRVDGDSAPVALAVSDFNERNGTVSPDGRWLLFESNASGRYEVYVRPFPATSASQTQVSTEGGSEAKWSRDGREIVYASLAGLMTAAVLPGASFAAGEPTLLFPLEGITRWDVTPDGTRFIGLGTTDKGRTSQLVVVENFLDELRQKVRSTR